jgi:hypothetical protein
MYLIPRVMASACAQKKKIRGSSSVGVPLNAQTLLVLYVNLQCRYYTLPMEQTDLFHSSAHRTEQRSASVRLRDSTHSIEVSTLHGYDYIEWWNFFMFF